MEMKTICLIIILIFEWSGLSALKSNTKEKLSSQCPTIENAAVNILKFSYKDEQKTHPISVKVEQEIKLVLESNPTTGYSWTVNKLDTSYLCAENLNTSDNTSSDYTSDPHEPGMVGYGGHHTFKFLAIKSGETEIQLQYKRLWESENPEPFILKVTIQEH
jgi:predicted secreted protein